MLFMYQNFLNKCKKKESKNRGYPRNVNKQNAKNEKILRIEEQEFGAESFFCHQQQTLL